MDRTNRPGDQSIWGSTSIRLAVITALILDIARMAVPSAVIGVAGLCTLLAVLVAKYFLGGKSSRRFSGLFSRDFFKSLWCLLVPSAIFIVAYLFSDERPRLVTIELFNVLAFLLIAITGWLVTQGAGHRCKLFERDCAVVLALGAVATAVAGFVKLYSLVSYTPSSWKGAPWGGSLLWDYNLFSYFMMLGLIAHVWLLIRGQATTIRQVLGLLGVWAMQSSVLFSGSRRGFLLILALAAVCLLATVVSFFPRPATSIGSQNLCKKLRSYRVFLLGSILLPLALICLGRLLTQSPHAFASLQLCTSIGASWKKFAPQVCQIYCRYEFLTERGEPGCFRDCMARDVLPPITESNVATVNRTLALMKLQRDIASGLIPEQTAPTTSQSNESTNSTELAESSVASSGPTLLLDTEDIGDLVALSKSSWASVGPARPAGAARIERWKFAMQHFRDQYDRFSMLFGRGFEYIFVFGERFPSSRTAASQSRAEDYPHNIFLSTLLFSGIVGAILNLSIFFPLFCLLRYKQMARSWLAPAYLLTLAFILSSDNTYFSLPATHCIPLALILSRYSPLLKESEARTRSAVQTASAAFSNTTNSYLL